MATPQRKNPCPCRPFLSYHYFIHRLSDLCLGVKKKIFKGIMHFHYMKYMATPKRKNPCPWDHEIYNSVRPYLGHHYYTFFCLNHAPEQKRRFFKEIHQFYHFYPKFTPSKISCLHALHMLYINFGYNWLISSFEHYTYLSTSYLIVSLWIDSV